MLITNILLGCILVVLLEQNLRLRHIRRYAEELVIKSIDLNTKLEGVKYDTDNIRRFGVNQDRS